jgi:hypothetical protein
MNMNIHQMLLKWSHQGGMAWVGIVACMREMRNAYNILIREPEMKRPLERRVHRCEKNIKSQLKGAAKL